MTLPQNQKYYMTWKTKLRPLWQHAQIFGKVRMWFLRYACKQTDSQTRGGVDLITHTRLPECIDQ